MFSRLFLIRIEVLDALFHCSTFSVNNVVFRYKRYEGNDIWREGGFRLADGGNYLFIWTVENGKRIFLKEKSEFSVALEAEFLQIIRRTPQSRGTFGEFQIFLGYLGISRKKAENGNNLEVMIELSRRLSFIFPKQGRPCTTLNHRKY